MMSFLVRDVDVEQDEHAEKLAAMFNDWDSSWPGGFTRGVTSTAAQARENERRTHHLAALVVEHAEEFVGYCNLEAAPGQKDVAYIGLLGAREKAHGKGVGKMLLREMMRRVTHMGFKQVTLNTWAGNTKAVPLYKKTGFFWVPETDVYMRNFLPTALNMPLLQEFLGDADWYDCLERELLVAPDDVTWKGMKVYPYRFRRGDRTLDLIFHRASEGLTGIKTPDFEVACVFPLEDVPAGQTYPITWEIASHRKGLQPPLEVALLANAETGLNLNVQESLRVEGRSEVTREVVIPSDTAPKRGSLPAYRLESTVLIDGQPIALQTGVTVVRPVEIEVDGLRLLPGREEKVTVRLRNRLTRDIEGLLTFDAHPNLYCETMSQPFALPAQSWTECSYQIRASKSGLARTQVVCEAENLRLEKPVAFRALEPNDVLGEVNVTDEWAMLEAWDTRAFAHLRGGGMNIDQPGVGRHLLHIGMAEFGPPFANHWLLPQLSEARIEHGSTGDMLVTIGKSEAFPGLRLERTAAILCSGLTRIEYRVFNTTNQPITAKLRQMSWPQVQDHLIVPLKTGLIREPLQSLREFPISEYDALPQGETLAENWIACEGEGLVTGLVFAGSPEPTMQWTHLAQLTHDLGEIPAHGVHVVPSIYAVTGNGTWKTVRDWWRRLIQPSGVIESETPEPKRVLQVSMNPPLLTEDVQNVELRLTNQRELALTGTLRLSDNVSCEPAEFALESVNRERPFTAQVTVRMPSEPSALLLTVAIDAVPVPHTQTLGVARLGTRGNIDVAVSEAKQIRVDNGNLRFVVDPAYLGAMIALEQGGVNHLFTCFPTPQPFIWANPWYGGLHPFLGWIGDARLSREVFTGEPVARTGGSGMAWQGARVVCQLQHKDLRWLEMEAEYLTAPGSNVLALVTRWKNKTDSRMSLNGDGGLGAWLQVGGARENAVAHAEINGERQTRRRGGFGMDTYAGKWKAVENPESGQTLLMIATGQKDKAVVEDFAKDGPHLAVQGELTLQPRETKETLAWLVLCPTTGEIDAYVAALSALRTLP